MQLMPISCHFRDCAEMGKSRDSCQQRYSECLVLDVAVGYSRGWTSPSRINCRRNHAKQLRPSKCRLRFTRRQTLLAGVVADTAFYGRTSRSASKKLLADAAGCSLIRVAASMQLSTFRMRVFQRFPTKRHL